MPQGSVAHSDSVTKGRPRISLARTSGQALVHIAFMLTTLIGLAGSGVDYGMLLIEDARLQHAVDAAGLAAVRSLVSGSNPGVPAATTAATSYLLLHGYQSDANTTITMTFSSSMGNSFMDTITLQVDRLRPTYFWRIFGMNNLPSRGRAVVAAAGGFVDVMLSLDLTKSMELSGTSDLPALRQAVVDFVNQMSLNPSNPVGPKIGMARFAGYKCSWHRSPGIGDGDTRIDIGPAASEYVTPCSDDQTLLTNLTMDANLLKKLGDNSGGATCPAPAVPYACPLKHWDYTAPVVSGTPTTPIGLQYGAINYDGYLPTYTGTKLPNGISVVNGGGYYAWSTANGGRNNASGEGWARKVLVMMTDGVNELFPSTGAPGNTVQWDTDVVSYASTLKLGPDGTAGTLDDVEIYVIGFFCTPYSTSTTSTPEKWCKSTLADTTPPHACPGTTWPGTIPAPSAIDTLLRDVSSSTAGTCTHYFPIKKTESLPQLFQVLAGSIGRGRLSQ